MYHAQGPAKRKAFVGPLILASPAHWLLWGAVIRGLTPACKHASRSAPCACDSIRLVPASHGIRVHLPADHRMLRAFSCSSILLPFACTSGTSPTYLVMQ